MEPIVLTKYLSAIDIIDLFDSIIWTERFRGVGDFELYLPTNANGLSFMVPDNLIQINGSKRTMVIESLHLNTDSENGHQYVVKGRSLESILDRRIVRKQTIINGSLQDGVALLLDQNAINPSDPDRKINKLVFQSSTDPLITGLTLDDQFFGETLLDVINYICQAYDIGFKIIVNSSGNFVFSLYAGVDRSFTSSGDSIVLFSPKMDNITNSQYLFSKVPHKTTTLVGGEGEGSDRKVIDVNRSGGALTDLDRREAFTDASMISSTYYDGTLSPSDYNLLLTSRGVRDLNGQSSLEVFDGQVDPSINYVYDRDYSLGDIVQIENEYGLNGTTRVQEFTFSEDKAGERFYPTFERI